MAQFYFSRFTIATDEHYLDKAQFLFNGLSSNGEISFRKDNYKFVMSAVRQIGSRLFVTAEMVKYKPEHTEKSLSEENEFESVAIKNKVLTSIRIILDPQNSILIHEEDKSHIPKETFAQRFIELFQKNYQDVPTQLTINPITESLSFMDRLFEVNLIKKITIQLVPTNPNNAETYRRIDERIRALNATRVTETISNNKTGESIAIEEETQAKFQMSEDGYGNSTVEGIDLDGKPIKISTKDIEKQVHVPIPDEKISLNEDITKLLPKLDEIIARTQEQDKP